MDRKQLQFSIIFFLRFQEQKSLFCKHLESDIRFFVALCDRCKELWNSFNNSFLICLGLNIIESCFVFDVGCLFKFSRDNWHHFSSSLGDKKLNCIIYAEPSKMFLVQPNYSTVNWAAFYHTTGQPPMSAQSVAKVWWGIVEKINCWKAVSEEKRIIVRLRILGKLSLLSFPKLTLTFLWLLFDSMLPSPLCILMTKIQFRLGEFNW